MRPNTKPSSKGHLGDGINSDVAKVQAPVCWKRDCGCLLNVHRDCLDAGNLLLSGHRWPFLVQLNALDVFHDDILATNDVRRVVAPVEDCWDWYSGIRLYCSADERQSVCSHHDRYPDSQYLMVATSELVVSLGGPATEVGSLATTRFALSQVKMKTLLKPPSSFS